jgi:nucleoside-diphosphate-sugar epimerase
MRRNILVTGATGKQGGALIRALLQAPTPATTTTYHIYALTRRISSPTAQSLLVTHGTSNLTLVEGDLEDRSSITAIFETAKLESDYTHSEPGIWGVFAVMAFPGLRASAESEERQGRMLAEIALEYGVKVYVYSSAIRAGPKYEDHLEGKPSAIAKRNIEIHCKDLGTRGLPWM